MLPNKKFILPRTLSLEFVFKPQRILRDNFLEIFNNMQ
ncbi:SLEI domain protein, PF07620 family [Leptospira interrogans str. 2003000735]|uniref:SLEI domain protein, PF07620 family n=10 Tax=Leptospira interrogans TaxID=173 RepID=A0A0E2D0T6_LEPIR|nr:hypothetical protein G436_2352 [Leptospira interrogans serovar Hardjo str. Norma]EJO79263.1 SLEI domain protein, PF07620 family [Leptospira interrogans serovar Pomona str. Kennewicki LC82-25]EJP04115.1 SLEI domain protein, PF07620 family [Leptospira interrogans serovar Bulgarica str. Mallika]EJP13844.1 SLEI domain protein, PF07620 family [Leptospira interrogans str. FPW2026]EKN88689.1 SLEI domain protein, PF07620 family [Leptospira interrogans str. 2002000624]EKN99062.1 SLEI motif protein [